MSLLVDNPIINSPFEEPARYWDYQEGQPVLVEGRRPAGYYLKARTRELPLLPLIERFRPIGSTSEVLFRTVRPCVGTTKSHISHVVLDAPKWEHSVAYQLERIPEVITYTRNDHLDFTIPYEWQGIRREYRPDYLVYLKTEKGNIIKVILEVKGFEVEQDRQKQIAAKRWVRAVNHHGEFGQWEFGVCKDPRRLREKIRSLLDHL